MMACYNVGYVDNKVETILWNRQQSKQKFLKN
jgi:hypothetical protein